MLKRLLVGVNGSRWSQAAGDIGVTWAAALKIPLTCLGVVDLSALAPAEAVPLGASQFKAVRDARLIARGHERIDAALKHLSQQSAAAGVECHLLKREGHPWVVLGEEAQRHDLLILGRRSIPGTDREPRASETLLEILRHSPRPIVVASQAIPDSSDIMIAYDGSVQAARTLQSFVSTGLSQDHRLHVVGVSNNPEQMQAVLERAADFLIAHALPAKTHVLPDESGVADALVQFAHRMPVGLMVLGAYGQPWYKELLFGSVTRSVVAEVPVPLFLNH